jgi:hypothetical protein
MVFQFKFIGSLDDKPEFCFTQKPTCAQILYRIASIHFSTSSELHIYSISNSIDSNWIGKWKYNPPV